MASTVYQNFSQPAIQADWLNDTNTFVYGNPFFQTGNNSVAQGILNKLKQVSKTVIDFGGLAAAGTSVDCRPALVAALAAGFICRFPEPAAGLQYYISSPITAVEGMYITAEGEAPVLMSRGVKIFAPNGFITCTVRTRFQLQGLWIVGSGTPGIKCIDGKVGGIFDGCMFQNYDVLVNNPQGYLMTFRRCKFRQANIGIAINEPNGSHVNDCFFESDVLVQIDCLTVLPTATQANGEPFTISDTNFNINTGTSRLAKLSGTVSFVDNYVEVFGAVGAGSVLIEYSAQRFGFWNFNVQRNHIVGNNNCERAIRIYSDNAAGTFQHGLIRGNWMRGFTLPPVQIGGGGASAIVSGIEVRDNETTQALGIEFSRREFPYNQIMSASYSAGTLNISGGTFVLVPLTNDLPNSGVDLTAAGGTAWTVGRDGVYEISVVASCTSTAAELRVLEGAIRVNGVSVDQKLQSLVRGVAPGNWYTAVEMNVIVNLALNDVVAMAFRNGDLLNTAKITAKRIGDNTYLKV